MTCIIKTVGCELRASRFEDRCQFTLTESKDSIDMLWITLLTGMKETFRMC